jgi:tRNA 2-selenouridine synthase
MSASLARIKKRLGGKLHAAILKSLDAAVEEQRRSGTADAHKEWMGMLLKEYYDPMYDYQIAGKSDRVLFRGSAGDIRSYLLREGFLPLSERESARDVSA